jgi:hypothetical protein
MLEQLCILIVGVNEFLEHNFLISHVIIYRQEIGSPRNKEDHLTFEKCTGIQPKLILSFDCSKEEMLKHLPKFV